MSITIIYIVTWRYALFMLHLQADEMIWVLNIKGEELLSIFSEKKSRDDQGA